MMALMDNLDTRVDVVDAMIVQMDNSALASVAQFGYAACGRAGAGDGCGRSTVTRDGSTPTLFRRSCTIYYADRIRGGAAADDG